MSEIHHKCMTLMLFYLPNVFVQVKYSISNSIKQTTIVGASSEGGLFNARLFSQISGSSHKLYGGNRSNGYRNKMMRRSGRQHVSQFYRQFKKKPGHMINLQGNTFGLMNKDNK